MLAPLTAWRSSGFSGISCVLPCRGVEEGHVSGECASDVVIRDMKDDEIKPISTITFANGGLANDRRLGVENATKKEPENYKPTTRLPALKPKVACGMPGRNATKPKSPGLTTKPMSPDLTTKPKSPDLTTKPKSPVLTTNPKSPYLTKECQRLVISRGPGEKFGFTLGKHLMSSPKGVSVHLPRDFELPPEGAEVLKVHSVENDQSIEAGDLIVKVLKYNGMNTSGLHATSLQMFEWMRAATTLEIMVFKKAITF